MSRIYCVRCDQPIRPGEPYDTHIHHGASLGGHTTYSHQRCPDLRGTDVQIDRHADNGQRSHYADDPPHHPYH